MIEVQKHWKLILLTATLIITGIFFIRPALSGYSVYQDLEKTNLTAAEYAKSMDEIQEELQVINANLSSYAIFNGQLLARVGEMSNELATKSAEIARLQTKLEEAGKLQAEKIRQLQDDLSLQEQETQQNLAQKESQLRNLTAGYSAQLESKIREGEQLAQQYDAFIAWTARSACCKEKVDDASINSYEVLNNKILCLNDGNRTLSC